MISWKRHKYYTNLHPEQLKSTFLWLILLVILAVPGVIVAQPVVQLENKVYDEKIKTVQLYPGGRMPADQLFSPTIPIAGNTALVLEFDELANDAEYYQVKLIHCDADWRQSELSSLQFIDTYNEFNIDEYEYSFDTTTPYVHYKFAVPKVKIPGNYVLIVYAEGNEEDVIITKRFMVYDQRVVFSDKYNLSNGAPYSRKNQQLLFEITYRGVDIVNPDQAVHVNITQNQRWDNAKINLRPTFVKEAQKIIEYRHFTDDNTFQGGNEFRFFDIRSLQYFGQNVKTVKFDKHIVYAWIEDDRSREGTAYGLERDYNGNFFIQNLERKIPAIENDYAVVYFNLKSVKLKGKVYIAGALTNWQYTNDNALKWNKTTETYQGSLLLKQGYYNYQYIVKGGNYNENLFEGNWGETENQYEIYFYYRPHDLQADLLIGYLNLPYNQRQ